jgi:hypothetical protein
MAEWLDEFPLTYHCELINVGGEGIASNLLTAAVLYKSTKPYYTALHRQYRPLEPVIQRPGVLRHDCQIKQVHRGPLIMPGRVGVRSTQALPLYGRRVEYRAGPAKVRPPI